MEQNLEILAPAGSPEALTAAVRSGASAVYLGASLFSARANAKNFDDAELKDAVIYCHARGVKVYLALNTLLLQDELPAALSLAEYACSLPVDALIVQDMGLAWLLRRCAPGMKLNASTQTSVHTPAGVRALADAGFGRAVLARELSLAEIREISDSLDRPIELEAFVHGALCMSVSGQCYFSSVLGSRSGNRGQCAQPCRLPFSVPGGTGHDLSLKDLSMISRIRELSGAGISSAKIEGRMKRPEYVAAATAACRFAAEGEAVPPDLLENLSSVFSRSGFTSGYPDGELGRGMFGVRSKEDVTGATNAVFSQLQGLYQKERPCVPVKFRLTILPGRPVELEATDADGRAALAVSEEHPQPARNRPVDEARCTEQLQKTGGTPFFLESAEYQIGDGLSVPVSLLNRLRREALAELEAKRGQRSPVPFSRCAIPSGEPPAGSGGKLRARFAHAGQVPENAACCELIYLPLDAPEQDFSSLLNRGFPVAAEVPRGMFGRERWARDKLSRLKSLGVSHCWAGNLGAAALGKEEGFCVHGGFSLNIVNTPALEWYREFGLADTELSFELTLQQAAALGGELPRGLVVYGRLPLMLCRNCPAKNGGGCQNCKSPPELTDRKGMRFPIQCGGGCSEVLNSVPLFLADRMKEIHNQNFAVLRFTVENSVESGEILEAYRNPAAAQKPHDGFTRGLYYRGIK